MLGSASNPSPASKRTPKPRSFGSRRCGALVVRSRGATDATGSGSSGAAAGGSGGSSGGTVGASRTGSGSFSVTLRTAGLLAAASTSTSTAMTSAAALASVVQSLACSVRAFVPTSAATSTSAMCSLPTRCTRTLALNGPASSPTYAATRSRTNAASGQPSGASHVSSPASTHAIMLAGERTASTRRSSCLVAAFVFRCCYRATALSGAKSPDLNRR